MTDRPLARPAAPKPWRALTASNPLIAARAGEARSPWARVHSAAICMIGAGVDATLAEPLFEHGLRLPTLACWGVAGGFALLAVHGGLRAGGLLRYHAWIPAAAAALAPAAIAVALFALRLNGDRLVVTQQVFEGSAVTANGTSETVLAPIMLLAFVATGVIAVLDGWWHADPLAGIRRRLAAAEADTAHREGRRARHLDELARHADGLRRLPGQLQQALATLDAVFDGLREHTRLRMAERLGDPRLTSGAHLPPPAATADRSATTE